MIEPATDEIVTTSVVRFITGDLDIESEWVWYLQQLDELGLRLRPVLAVRDGVIVTERRYAKKSPDGCGAVFGVKTSHVMRASQRIATRS